jgi:predicted nucleotidyltransferase
MAPDLETVTMAAKNFACHVSKLMPVDRVYLYGSYAKGCATEFSDVDICIFLRDFGDKRRFDILYELLGVARRCNYVYNDIFIEPNVFESSDLYDDNPFVKEVLRTGIEIWPCRSSNGA